MRVGGVVAAECAQERENVLAHHGVHVTRGEMLEARPAQVVVRTAPAFANTVLARGENPAPDGLLEPGGLVLLQRVEIVQAAQKEQVGDLLDHLERV
jgi:hypothetical protein